MWTDCSTPSAGRLCDLPCIHLQTISTKYRKQQEDRSMPVDCTRHYYDVYLLLQRPAVQAFIGTPPYLKHKDDLFPRADKRTSARTPPFNCRTTKRVSSTSAPMGRAARFTIRASRPSRKFSQCSMSGRTGSKSRAQRVRFSRHIVWMRS